MPYANSHYTSIRFDSVNFTGRHESMQSRPWKGIWMRIPTSGFLKAFGHFLVPAIPLFSLAFALAPVPVQAQAAELRVNGTLFVGTLSDNPNSALSEVELPDAAVTLSEPGGKVVDTTTTSLDGRFSLSAAPGRTYELCWEAQGQNGCATRVKVEKFPSFVGRVRAGLKGPLVFGTVLTGDARPCWVQDAFFGLDVSTKIRGGGQSTRANVQGEYVLAVPANATFRVQAGCELSEAGQTVTATGLLQRVDLNLGNHAPRITSLAATNGTRFLTRAQMVRR